MKIILHLADSEGLREVEDVEENMRAAYREIMRKIEDICTYHQIRYEHIEVIFAEKKE